MFSGRTTALRCWIMRLTKGMLALRPSVVLGMLSGGLVLSMTNRSEAGQLTAAGSPRYFVTSMPLSLFGLSNHLCIAVDPTDPTGVWWWEPGASGCASRSTGPDVFPAESATVTRTGPSSFQVRFTLQRHSNVPLDVRLEAQDSRMWSAATPDISVQLLQRDNLDVPPSAPRLPR